MPFVTGKYLPRRTFLKGMGATVALPFLDAMVPAGRVRRMEQDPTRLIAIEIVHGAAGSTEFGRQMHLWSPAKLGRDFELNPAGALSSLEEYKDYLTIISNTDAGMADAFAPEEVGGDHPRSSAVFLTHSHPKKTQGSDVFCGTSLDQIYAQRFGQSTPIPSMQLGIENIEGGGGCSYGYSCTYMDGISWASPTEPLPAIRDPRAAFDLLFGVGESAADRALVRRNHQSILDWIATDIARLKRELFPEDRERIDQYLENIREIERRIQGIEQANTSGEAREIPEAPPGVPDSFDEHVKLMYDLQVLAFQMDMTRVISFKLARDVSGRVYPESGSPVPFHVSSHHANRDEGVLDFNGINKYHVSTLTYLLDKLKDSVEGDTHLLDKTMLIYGSPMGDANIHNHRRCPLIVLGGANGQLKGGVHLMAPDKTPMANPMLTMLHKLGVDDIESFGNSTGEFAFDVPSGSPLTTAGSRSGGVG